MIGLAVASVAFLFFWKWLREAHLNRYYQNKGLFGRPNEIQPNGLIQISMEQYRAQMLKTTEREKALLLDSEEYKEAIKRKGMRQSAWNW